MGVIAVKLSYQHHCKYDWRDDLCQEETGYSHIQERVHHGAAVQEVAVLQHAINEHVLLDKEYRIFQVGEVRVSTHKIVRHGRRIAA